MSNKQNVPITMTEVRRAVRERLFAERSEKILAATEASFGPSPEPTYHQVGGLSTFAAYRAAKLAEQR